MKDDYYRLKGWDVKTGLLTRPALEKLDLSDVADRLGI
jgi:aldehyde:ferredoxin oxidoreductase